MTGITARDHAGRAARTSRAVGRGALAGRTGLGVAPAATRPPCRTAATRSTAPATAEITRPAARKTGMNTPWSGGSWVMTAARARSPMAYVDDELNQGK